jgi:hypothetical protein
LSAKADNGETDVDVKDFANSIDFGLGYKLDSGLNCALCYNLGLSNVNDREDCDDVEN